LLNQKYLRPETLDEAVNLLALHGKKLKVLAGGTDIIIGLRENVIDCEYLMDIKRIPEMMEIRYSEEEGLSIGGAVSLNEVKDCSEVSEYYDILKTALNTLANSLLRNRATMVGNICNSSPGGDMLPAALVLGGVVEAVSSEGKRLIPLKQFFLGVKKNVLRENELALRVILPPTKGKGIYLKKQRIKGHDLSQVGVAAYLKEDGALSIALGAVAPVPILINDLGTYSKEQLRDDKTVKTVVTKVLKAINPISDQRASKEYRIAMAKHFTVQALRELAKEV
jgi:CO/xanthine dehydrogenase FAD-binding subunit